MAYDIAAAAAMNDGMVLVSSTEWEPDATYDHEHRWGVVETDFIRNVERCFVPGCGLFRSPQWERSRLIIEVWDYPDVADIADRMPTTQMRFRHEPRGGDAEQTDP